MLGMYVMGLDWTLAHVAFAALIACCLAAAYMTIGSTWFIYKMEDLLQKKAVTWAKRTLIFTAFGMGTISLATPLVSPRIFDKWFSFPEILALAPLPLGAGALFLGLVLILRKLPKDKDRHAWLPLFLTGNIFVLGFLGLAYSFYPYVVPDKISIYEAASAPESLFIILLGAMVVMPAIAAYTVLSYVVFRGKARALTYD